LRSANGRNKPSQRQSSNSLHLRCIALLCILVELCVVSAGAQAPADTTVVVNWGKASEVLRTTATLQIATQPPLLRDSPIHDRLFKALSELQADYVRYIPYYPHPKLVVAELDPPRDHKTSWDFSLLDPTMEDFMRATAGHPVVVNFSTIPAWMFKTAKPVAYPFDPSQVADDAYTQATSLRDPSMKEVADYYARLISWYSCGGFTDEYGKWHGSGHHYKIDYWEVLNEVEFEHSMTPEFYTALYDKVVMAIHQVAPRMKFIGLSLEGTSPLQAFNFDDPPFFQYFLNPRNHKPGVPLDMISYHFYGEPSPDEPPETWQFSLFNQANHFLDVVNYIESIRKKLSPATQTDVDEVGTILHNPDHIIPDFYWNLSAAMFAYVYLRLARMGIEIVAASQFTEFPIDFPSFSMVDMKTGQPNARFWLIKLIRDNLEPGDKLVETALPLTSVYAQGFVTQKGKQKLLLINERQRAVEVTIPGAEGAEEEFVDETTANNPPGHSHLEGNKVNLGAFAVAAVTLP
jgi:hypothetical protein